MIVVQKKRGESKDKLFRKFTRIFRDEDVVFEVNRKTFYKSPSLLKKEKQRERMKKKAYRKAYGTGVYRSQVQVR